MPSSKLTHRNNKAVNNHSLYQTNLLVDSTNILNDIKNNTAELDLNTDTLESKLTDGTQKSQVLGNTAGDGTGDSKHLLTDTTGRQLINWTTTPNIKLEDLSSSINSDNANHSRSIAVGLRGRTNISDSATGEFLLCNSSGRLQVDVITGAGGDATAANQTTANGHLSTIEGDTTSIDGKMSKGNDDSIAAATGAFQSLVYGLNDGNGNLYALKVGIDGNLHVHDADVTSGNDATITNGQQVLTYARSTESGNAITAVACDNSGVLSVDSSKFTQGYDATISSGGNGLMQVACFGRDSSGNLDALLVDNNGHLKIIVETVENKGSHANVQNGTLNFGNSSSSVDVSDYNHAVFLYEDTNTSTFDNPKVEVSVNDTDFYELSTQPLINTGSSKRTGTQEYKLHGIKYLRISNNSTADNFTNAKATIVGTPN